MLVAQSCPTLCDSMDCSPPGSSVHEILQGYWSGLPFPSPGDIPNPGIEPRSPALQADPVPTELQGKPNKLYIILIIYCVPSMYRFGVNLLNVFSFNLHCDSTRIINLYEEMEAQEKSVSCLPLQSCKLNLRVPRGLRKESPHYNKSSQRDHYGGLERVPKDRTEMLKQTKLEEKG